MDAIVNKLLLLGDKFMPEIHLRQSQFTYSACGPFTKNMLVFYRKCVRHWFLLYVIDIYNKYARVFLSKYKGEITITNAL